jgi:hypothetical protein
MLTGKTFSNLSGKAVNPIYTTKRVKYRAKIGSLTNKRIMVAEDKQIKSIPLSVGGNNGGPTAPPTTPFSLFRSRNEQTR